MKSHADGAPSGAIVRAIPAGLTRIAPGEFHISLESDRRVRETSGGIASESDDAHPIFGFIAALGGLGMPIGEVFTLCGGSIERGPLLASCDLHFDRPLKIGMTYQVGGAVKSLIRKPSRRFGHADHLALEIAVRDGTTACSTLTLTIIMPTGDET